MSHLSSNLWMVRLVTLGLLGCWSCNSGSTSNDTDGAVSDSGLTQNDGALGADASNTNDSGPYVPFVPGGPSEGCGSTVSQTGSPVEQTIQIAGQPTRSYTIAVPSNYNNAQPYPLFLGFGGFSGAQGDFVYQGSGVDATQAIFVTLQALSSGDYDGASYTGALWRANDVSDPSKYVPLEVESDNLAFFDALVEHLLSNYCVDTDRIFASGFSAGGGFTSLLGCVRGDVLRAMAPIAPFLPENYTSNCQGVVAAYIGVGANDSTNSGLSKPISQAASDLKEELRVANSCSTNSTAAATNCVQYNDCTTGLDVMWCEVPNQQHTSPDVASTLYGKSTFDFFMNLNPESS
ncbi:MAG: hypothetical protein IPJ88_18255 [Myxococcales bacterium]|nr:MAG: hypothetical protein IPJ88_18255 [Myxococcales bacterium]